MHNWNHRIPLFPEDVSPVAIQPSHVNAAASPQAMSRPVVIIPGHVRAGIFGLCTPCVPGFWAEHGRFWNIFEKLCLSDGHATRQVHFEGNVQSQSDNWTNLLLQLHGVDGVHSHQYVFIHNQRCFHRSSQRCG